ncbi:uncharacterized protein LOC144138294 isoform X2 [Haemaphysalis longicornis]
MSSEEAMMAAIRDIGDPDELANLQDSVVLKLEKPLSTGHTPPEVALDSSGLLLTANREVFMKLQDFFAKQSISVAVFAGCPELGSTPTFLAASRKALRGRTKRLIIVHNRDRIDDLVDWFPAVTALILYHDLRLHAGGAKNKRRTKQPSQLQWLCGTAPGIGAHNLYISSELLDDLLFLKCMNLTTTSTAVIACLSSFFNLTRLSVTYFADRPCPFDGYITHLRTVPFLTDLALSHFDDVSFAIIAKTFVALKNLTIIACSVRNESIPPDGLNSLKSLQLSTFIPPDTFRTIFAAAGSLSELYLSSGITVAAFLASESQPWKTLKRLQRLTLATRAPLKRLGVDPEHLHAAIRSMPELKRLSTDSYDIRLFVGNYYPQVSLAWLTCTVCAADFPKLSAFQERFWEAVQPKAKKASLLELLF